MNVNIPNWPLSSIEKQSFKKILLTWLFSFYKSERQSMYTTIGNETIFLDF